MSTSITRTPRLKVQEKSPLSFAEDFSALMRKIDEEIAQSAFGSFQKRGSQPGSALDDWLQAEASTLEPLSISVEDAGDKLKVSAAVLGFPEKDLRVHVRHHSELRICGKTEETRKKPDGTEHSTRTIRGTVSLPVAVESKGAFFTVENGVLTLMLPKVETVQDAKAA